MIEPKEDDEYSEVSEYLDYEYGEIYDEYEEEFEKLEGEDEDEIEEEETTSEETDILTDYMVKFAAQRTKELEVKAEAQKEQLRLLIGIQKKKDDEVSEETIITPDEEEILTVKSSSGSSVYPCFRDIDISDSQLKLTNLYTAYPIPEDPGVVPSFWTIIPPPPLYEDNGVQKFFDLAKKHGVVPIKSVREMLLANNINLQYYGIDPTVLKILCKALENNTTVETINLKDNFLPANACHYLSQLLARNNIVHALILSGCRIGINGAKKLSYGISNNLSLRTLDLSGCNLRNEGLFHVTSAVCNNQSLENLLLNNNNLDESCAEALQLLVSCSETLKRLELSWNSLHTAETWKMLIKGLEKAVALTELNLSWNALSNACVPHLNKFLSRPSSIEKLTLSGNRFYDPDALLIAKALSKNKGLRELYMGNNPLKASGALALVQAVTTKKSSNSALRLLDLRNVWANKNILEELETIKNNRPELKVKLGGILSNYKIVGPDPKKILLKRANWESMKSKKKKLRKNFGHFVLSLDDTLISQDKFKELVKSFRLKLSESLLGEIIKVFSGPKNTVDGAFIKSFYLEQYPDTKPVPEKKTKKDNTNSKKKGK